MSDVDGYLLQQWQLDRKSDNIKQITLHNNVKHLRRFIRWCESSEIVSEGLADKMEVPEVSDSQIKSDDVLHPATAEKLLTYFEEFEYGTRNHALFALLWHIGCRVSAAIALDLDDYEQLEGYVKFRNREQTGTPLKNGKKSERNVTLSEDVQAVVTDYIEARRRPMTDDHGRDPLFTTHEGTRVSRQTIYKNVVGYTRPCIYTNDCPHNREIASCEAYQQKTAAPKCPSSTSMHPVRRGSITYHLNQGWPKEEVSERCDVSVEVLEKHYDNRTEENKRERRREFVEDL